MLKLLKTAISSNKHIRQTSAGQVLQFLHKSTGDLKWSPTPPSAENGDRVLYLVEMRISPIFSSFGGEKTRENLQETMVFLVKYCGFPAFSSEISGKNMEASWMMFEDVQCCNHQGTSQIFKCQTLLNSTKRVGPLTYRLYLASDNKAMEHVLQCQDD